MQAEPALDNALSTWYTPGNHARHVPTSSFKISVQQEKAKEKALQQLSKLKSHTSAAAIKAQQMLEANSKYFKLPHPKMSSTCRPNRPVSGGCFTLLPLSWACVVHACVFGCIVVVGHEEAWIQWMDNDAKLEFSCFIVPSSWGVT